MEMTGGIGPDACIDAVGLEAHGFFADNVWDQIKVATFMGTDRAHSIRQAILACRKGGRVSMPAVYGGFVDNFPLGAFMAKRSEEHTSELQSLMRISYAVFCLKKNKTSIIKHHILSPILV